MKTKMKIDMKPLFAILSLLLFHDSRGAFRLFSLSFFIDLLVCLPFCMCVDAWCLCCRVGVREWLCPVTDVHTAGWALSVGWEAKRQPPSILAQSLTPI